METLRWYVVLTLTLFLVLPACKSDSDATQSDPRAAVGSLHTVLARYLTATSASDIPRDDGSVPEGSLAPLGMAVQGMTAKGFLAPSPGLSASDQENLILDYAKSLGMTPPSSILPASDMSQLTNDQQQVARGWAQVLAGQVVFQQHNPGPHAGRGFQAFFPPVANPGHAFNNGGIVACFMDFRPQCSLLTGWCEQAALDRIAAGQSRPLCWGWDANGNQWPIGANYIAGTHTLANINWGGPAGTCPVAWRCVEVPL